MEFEPGKSAEEALEIVQSNIRGADSEQTDGAGNNQDQNNRTTAMEELYHQEDDLLRKIHEG